MSELLKIDMMDLGGGLNLGEDKTNIGDSEFVESNNFYSWGKKKIRRSGVTRITDTPHPTEIVSSMFVLKRSDGVWQLLVGRQTGFSKLVGTGLVDIPFSGALPASSLYPWVQYQYRDIGYATRPNSGYPKRVTQDVAMDAGIAAPVVAPTLADGAVGAIPAANFYGVYSYYNQDTAAESIYSPESVVLAHGANLKINWSGVTISPNIQVNARRLYRTLPNQTGQYFYVGMIGDNIGTVYNGDNVTVKLLGNVASLDYGLPPVGACWGDLWQDRLWVTDTRDLWYSEFMLPECFGGGDHVIQINPDDGHQMRGIKAFGSRLLVGKTNKMYIVTGFSEADFSWTCISDVHGCSSHYSMQVFEGRAMWLGPDNFYVSDGSIVRAVGDVKIRSLVDQIPDAWKDRVSAEVYPERGWYVVSIPVDDSGFNKLTLVYNYRADTWDTWSFNPYSPKTMATVFDANMERLLYAGFYDGYIYQLMSGQVDQIGVGAGSPFTASFKTKAYGLDTPAMMKGLRRVTLRCSTVNESAVLTSYRDDGTAIRTRTVRLNDPSTPYKRYGLGMLGGGASETFQLGVSYSGTSDWEVEALLFEVATWMRAMRAR